MPDFQAQCPAKILRVRVGKRLHFQSDANATEMLGFAAKLLQGQEKQWIQGNVVLLPYQFNF